MNEHRDTKERVERKNKRNFQLLFKSWRLIAEVNMYSEVLEINYL